MQLTIKGNDWITKNLQIKDATHQVLKTGKVVPTAANMLRQIAKAQYEALYWMQTRKGVE